MKRLWYQILCVLGLPKNKWPIHQKHLSIKVLSKFNRLFATASHVQWYIRNGLFESRFQLDNHHDIVFFTASGNLIEQLEEIEIINVPKVVSKNIAMRYAGHAIVDIYRGVYHHDIIYKITFLKKYKIIKTEFDSRGHVIKETTY